MHGRPDAASQQPHPSTWLEGFVTWRPKKTHPVLRTFSLVWNSFVKNTPWISVFTRRWPVPRQKTDVYSEDRGLGALKRMRDDGIFVWWPWLSTSYGYHFLWEVCSKEVLTTYFFGGQFFFRGFNGGHSLRNKIECSHVILRWTGHDQYNFALVDIFCLCRDDSSNCCSWPVSGWSRQSFFVAWIWIILNPQNCSQCFVDLFTTFLSWFIPNLVERVKLRIPFLALGPASILLQSIFGGLFVWNSGRSAVLSATCWNLIFMNSFQLFVVFQRSLGLVKVKLCG